MHFILSIGVFLILLVLASQGGGGGAGFRWWRAFLGFWIIGSALWGAFIFIVASASPVVTPEAVIIAGAMPPALLFIVGLLIRASGG